MFSEICNIVWTSDGHKNVNSVGFDSATLKCSFPFRKYHAFMKVGNIMPTYRFLPREFYIRTTEEEILKFMTKNTSLFNNWV